MTTKIYHHARGNQNSDLWSRDIDHEDQLLIIISVPVAMALINKLASRLIESLLLRNFPEWSRRWVFIYDHKPSQREPSQREPAQRETNTPLQSLQYQTSFFAYFAGFLIRWLDWGHLHPELWECICLTFLAWFVLQVTVVLSLLGLVVFLRVAERLMIWTGWLPIQHRSQSAPTKLGRWLSKIGSFFFNQFPKPPKEVFHPITAHPGYEDQSFEELRLKEPSETQSVDQIHPSDGPKDLLADGTFKLTELPTIQRGARTASARPNGRQQPSRLRR